jgi:hypothetical protein
MGGGWPRPRPGRFLVPIVPEAGWAPEPVWTGAENQTPTGFDPRTIQPVASIFFKLYLSRTEHDLFS